MKTPPVIGNLLTDGHRSRVMEVITSPRTPLDFQILSPRGIVDRDVGGVGLGILAALDKSTTTSCRRNPVQIPVNQLPKDGVDDEESLKEEYTIVTRHMPNNSYTTKLYDYDGGFVSEGYFTKKGMKIGSKTRESSCLFDISPARLDIKWHPAPDFLSSCHLCNKKLHGKDIYMYRGEKAFCSIECRCREMGMEERREKDCRAEACSHGQRQMLSTGIFGI